MGVEDPSLSHRVTGAMHNTRYTLFIHALSDCHDSPHTPTYHEVGCGMHPETWMPVAVKLGFIFEPDGEYGARLIKPDGNGTDTQAMFIITSSQVTKRMDGYWLRMTRAEIADVIA